MNLKKLITIGLSALLLIGSVGFTSCNNKNNNKSKVQRFEKDGITYVYHSGKDAYYLRQDKEENNPTVWHINPYYEGREVEYFGSSSGGGGFMSSVGAFAPSLLNVDELSLPYCMKVWDGVSLNAIKNVPRKIIIIENLDNLRYFIRTNHEDYEDPTYVRTLYCSSISYEHRIADFIDERHDGWSDGTHEFLSGEYYFCYEKGNNGYIHERFKICKANTAYMFNYTDAPNDGYFFIQDFEYGKTIEDTPYIPLREGYIFGGWYKEAACINKWDFEKDTLPQTLYNENGEEVYQETKLYAKWIEN